MDDKQREGLFSFFLALIFIAAAIYMNLFRLGEQPLFSGLVLLSCWLLGYLISMKGENVGLSPVHSVLFLLMALLISAVKSELSVVIAATLAFPVSVVILLSFLGPLRASLFRKAKK